MEGNVPIIAACQCWRNVSFTLNLFVMMSTAEPLWEKPTVARNSFSRSRWWCVKKREKKRGKRTAAMAH